MSVEYDRGPGSADDAGRDEVNHLLPPPALDDGWEDERDESGVGADFNVAEDDAEEDSAVEDDADGEAWDEGDESAATLPEVPAPNLSARMPSAPRSRGELPYRTGWDGRQGRKLVKPDELRLTFSPQERLLILDTWQRSGLPAGDFAPLVGLSKHTLYLWKKRFTRQGPAGLMEQPRGATSGSMTAMSEMAESTWRVVSPQQP